MNFKIITSFYKANFLNKKNTMKKKLKIIKKIKSC